METSKHRFRFLEKWESRLASLVFHDTPPEVQLAEKGLAALLNQDAKTALPLLKEAKQIDPGIVGPYHWARALYESGAPSLSDVQAIRSSYHPDSWHKRAKHSHWIDETLKLLQTTPS